MIRFTDVYLRNFRSDFIYKGEDLRAQTDGIECPKDKGVVDEIPGACKDIEEVMRAQSDLVEVVAELKQVVCVKG